MPKPLIAIVGRPNVGKSALFNRLARKRIALVEDFEGTTRDRLYTDIDIWGRQCTLIDTGGFDNMDREGYTPAILDSTQIGIEQADLIVFLTDGREEPTTLDYEIADVLRRTRKPVLVAANKIDQPHMKVANLYALRLGEVIPMSAMGGFGVAELTERIEDLLPPAELDDAVDSSTKIALVGRPNVGKSQLTNTILGYERSIVSPVPGTTRDAIDTHLKWKDETDLTLIDTAGMRRKARVRAEKDATEYHMVLRSLRAIDRADVVVVMIESGGITDQDTKIAGYAHEAGKPMIVAVNKRDLIEKPTNLEKKTTAQKDFEVDLKNYLPFVSYAPIHYLSGLNNWGVEEIVDDAIEVSKNGEFRVTTGQLNDIIRRAVAEHPVPSVKGRPVKIRYATQFGVNPPSIAVFVNQPELLHFSYVRRIENVIRAKFPFRGVPLKIDVRKSNPRDEKFEKHG